MVIALWKNEKSGSEGNVGYYRARIRSIECEVCRIVFVDYGNECDIERSKLFSCPERNVRKESFDIRKRC